MSKTAPWIKFFAADFLNGIVDLDADEIGAYTVVLALIWDRGTPIADDAAWLARRAGTSTRRFNQIRAKLISLGKLEARNGLLGNRRAIEEVQARDKKSDQARSAALSRWYGHGEPELPLDPKKDETNADYLKKKRGKKPEKVQEQNDLKSSKNEQKPQNSANEGDADAYFPSRAPAFQSPESRVITNIPLDIEGSENAGSIDTDDVNGSDALPAEPQLSRLDQTDLKALYDLATEAAGFSPSKPFIIDREWAIVQKWRDDGIDFELVVIPTIRAWLARTDEPTNSLKRFDRQIRLEFAKAGAKPREGSAAYQPPATPIVEVEGEDGRLRAIRVGLLKNLGASAYCTQINPIRFEVIEDAGADRKPIKIIDRRPSSMQVANSPTRATILNLAQSQGFTDVW